ncbi:MAG: YciI family protein [Acidobacteriaceae bacterium]|nr:YciI family protein [Acidobacteriaceae bacterium]MBV9443690.1 YciI family protein [Acidobacteriaceae bacterium]
MKYMLLIYGDEQQWTDGVREDCYRESIGLAHQLKENGQFIDTSPLQPTSTATSVRVREGKRFVTDGPFAETREQLGGYFVVNAKDLDEAIGIAEKIPAARMGTVEIRPLIELEGIPLSDLDGGNQL